jgi:acyl-CoA reductase-like NAD-dependent aldehyde dehydrogenase
MNHKPRQRAANQRRRSATKRAPADIWRDTGPLGEVVPVTPSNDATALVRSLGEPPLAGGEAVLLQFATVIERSASIAAAVALSAGVLADDDESPPLP